MRFIPYILILFLTACGHKSQVTSEVRTPASSTHESHLTSEEVQIIAKALDAKDSKFFELILKKVSQAQSLLASFDARVDALQNQADANVLLNSKLYCRLQDFRYIQEKLDDQLVQTFEIISARSQDHEWLISVLDTFASKSVLNEVTTIHLLRLIEENKKSICTKPDCVQHIAAKIKLNVNPFDDEALYEYVKSNRKSIAKFTAPQAWDLKPGSCFSESRSPQQEAPYDWKNRNWVGSVLPEGQFAITYDDGPSVEYTRTLRDLWVNARMAKPAFFWLTLQAKKYPDIARELYSQGYNIGSHSDGHPDLGNLARANSFADFGDTNSHFYKNVIPQVTDFNAWKRNELDKQIPIARAKLSEIVGGQINYFRLPFGSGTKNPLIGRYFQKMNVEHFFWRVDSLDWGDKNPVSIRNRVISQMATVKKGIILFHDIHPQTVTATRLLIEYFKAHPGLRAVGLEEIPGLKR